MKKYDLNVSLEEKIETMGDLLLDSLKNYPEDRQTIRIRYLTYKDLIKAYIIKNNEQPETKSIQIKELYNIWEKAWDKNASN